MGELEAASAALGVACSMPPAWERIFVTDMPLGLDESSISLIFAAFGTVLSTRIVSKPCMRVTSALVEFSSVLEAVRACDAGVAWINQKGEEQNLEYW